MLALIQTQVIGLGCRCQLFLLSLEYPVLIIVPLQPGMTS